MRLVHILRKPLSEGTVASNTLKHGAGGLNIDASRINTTGERPMRERADKALPKNVYGAGLGGSIAVAPTTVGRWPANVILQHLEGCRRDGVKKVKGNRTDTRPDGDGGRADKSQWRFRPTDQTKRGFSEDDGKETVANWVCEPGCPVARLDANSLAGGMHSAGLGRSAKREAGKTGMFPMDGDGHRFGDKGGASRFYKQVGGSGE